MEVTSITTQSELERVVGSQPLGSMLKSIAAFDQHCADLLAVSPLAVLGTTGTDGARRTIVVGGSAGFATVTSPTRLAIDLPGGLDAAPNAGAGLLFLVPGLGETLRVNGRLHRDGVEAEEVYVHCAKAVLRSDLWRDDHTAAPEHLLPGDLARVDDGPLDAPGVREFLARGRFVVLNSANGGGASDASPKGDPAGFVRVLDGQTLAFPDRPGNRRTDTFHNLVEDSAIGMLVLVPGDDRVLELRGRARLTTDDGLRAAMAVQDRVPKLAVLVDVAYAALAARASPLAAARIWDRTTHIDPTTLPKMTQVWADHVRANEQGGLAAAAIRKVVSTKALDLAIAADYRKNLY